MKIWQWIVIICVIGLACSWYCGVFDFFFGDKDSGLYIFYVFIGAALLALFVNLNRAWMSDARMNLVKYDFGFPGMEGGKQGRLKTENDCLVFEDLIDGKDFFSIPLKEIINVKQTENLIGWASATVFGFHGESTAPLAFGDTQYFLVWFKQGAKENPVCFSANTKTPAFVDLEEKLRLLRKKSGFPLPEEKKTEKERKIALKDIGKIALFLPLFFLLCWLTAFIRSVLAVIFVSSSKLTDFAVYFLFVFMAICFIVCVFRSRSEE